MITDRRARKLLILCDKLGVSGVQKYLREDRFGAEKMPIINTWLEMKIAEAEEKAKKAVKVEATAKPAKKAKSK